MDGVARYTAQLDTLQDREKKKYAKEQLKYYEEKAEKYLDLFKTYAEGFLKGCNGSLTQTELELLPVGAMMMTLECGMRFLTDYLNGDTYFRTHYEGQNLDRCRTQFKLVSDMEKRIDEMNDIISRI